MIDDLYIHNFPDLVYIAEDGGREMVAYAEPTTLNMAVLIDKIQEMTEAINYLLEASRDD